MIFPKYIKPYEGWDEKYWGLFEPELNEILWGSNNNLIPFLKIALEHYETECGRNIYSVSIEEAIQRLKEYQILIDAENI